MKYNELPAHSSWAFKKDADRLAAENKATYEALRKVCTRGELPCGGKVVVKEMGPVYHRRRFKVICNPIQLDSKHIALFCDRGNLCFGYTVTNSGGIEIFTD